MYTRVEAGVDISHSKDVQPRELDFAQKVQERFQSAFVQVFQEQGLGLTPEVAVDPLFLPHSGSFPDSERYKEEFKKHNPDIIIVERPGWPKKYLELLRTLSSSDKLDRRLKSAINRLDPILKPDAEVVQGNKKAITIIDPSIEEFNENEYDETWNYDPNLEGSFSEVLVYTKDHIKNISLHIKNREQGMLDRINIDHVGNLLEIYPSLKDLRKINILLSLGSGHGPLPSDYSDYTFTDEAIIKNKYHVEPENEESVKEPVDDVLASKVFLERVFDKLSVELPYWLKKDTIKFSRFTRKTFARFTFGDAVEIFECIKKIKDSVPNSDSHAPEELKDLFYSILEKRNFKVLHNPKELDEFLAEPESQQPQIAP